MKTFIKNQSSALLLLCVLLASAFLVFGPHVFADITQRQKSEVGLYNAYTFFATTTNNSIAATTTTATSTNILSWFNSSSQLDTGYMVIAHAEKVNLIFQRKASGAGDVNNAGSSLFKIQVAATSSSTGIPDTWYDYANLVSQTPTSTANTATGGAITLTATSTVIAAMNNLGFFAIRCIAVVTTDGTNYCSAEAQY